jgi:hypothetical protein
MDYQKGKIYKIESHLGDKIYVGSTTKEYLSQRMTAHRASYNAWKKGKDSNVTTFQLFEEYGVDNCNIVLIELCPCKSKDELSAKEAHYIRTLECVNKCIPGRTQKQYVEDNKDKILEYQKQYHEVNKEKISEKMKQYRENHKDHIKDIKKQFYNENKDKIKDYMTKYNEENKEKLKERDKRPFTCECGCTVQHAEKARHQRSKKHIEIMKNKTN